MAALLGHLEAWEAWYGLSEPESSASPACPEVAWGPVQELLAVLSLRWDAASSALPQAGTVPGAAAG